MLLKQFFSIFFCGKCEYFKIKAFPSTAVRAIVNCDGKTVMIKLRWSYLSPNNDSNKVNGIFTLPNKKYKYVTIYMYKYINLQKAVKFHLHSWEWWLNQWLWMELKYFFLEEMSKIDCKMLAPNLDSFFLNHKL